MVCKHEFYRMSLVPLSASSAEATFGVFGSYAVVEDASSRSVALPTTTSTQKRPRDVAGGPPRRSSRRPAPATLRLEDNASPYGVAPEGCLLLPAAAPQSRAPGLGALRILPDDVVLYLLGWLDARSLCAFSSTSSALYVFSHASDAWRALALSAARADGLEADGGAPLARSWIAAPDWKSALMARFGAKSRHAPLRTHGRLYSDLLFKAAACAGASIAQSWAKQDSLVRVRGPISASEFASRFEGNNAQPVVLEGAAPWALNQDVWSPDALEKSAGESLFHCGGVRMTLRDFFAYSRAVDGRDDRPLYLFERNFSTLAPATAAAFFAPPAVSEDLLSVLGGSPYRPDHTWLIAGPRKSGSTFHKDPNASSAWNACVRGLKAWIFYPPQATPPGVVVGSGDGGEGSEVATPVSVLEWYADHWPAHAARARKGGPDAPVAGLQRPGDVVVVPAGWWHQVLNLQESVAVTHNFVSQSNLGTALELARDDPAALSGIPTSLQDSFYAEWRKALKEHNGAELELAETGSAATASAPQQTSAKEGPGRWAAITRADTGTFSLAASWK